jgi:hypothetical protein
MHWLITSTFFCFCHLTILSYIFIESIHFIGGLLAFMLYVYQIVIIICSRHFILALCMGTHHLLHPVACNWWGHRSIIVRWDIPAESYLVPFWYTGIIELQLAKLQLIWTWYAKLEMLCTPFAGNMWNTWFVYSNCETDRTRWRGENSMFCWNRSSRCSL